MEIKPLTALNAGNLHLQPVFLQSIVKIVVLLLNSVHILTENQGEGRTRGTNICVGWECKSVGGF